MKKIPTVFKRTFENHRIVDIENIITPGCEEAFFEGIATVKFDGACCAVINGKLYKRFDAKRDRKVPAGAIPCCDPDPVTGHWPHWVLVDYGNPADIWFIEALWNYSFVPVEGTYEAIGPHFQGNPYGCAYDTLVKHGNKTVAVHRKFKDVKNFLAENPIEGIVFWLNGEPVCKIKRTDFGFEWPIRHNREEQKMVDVSKYIGDPVTYIEKICGAKLNCYQEELVKRYANAINFSPDFEANRSIK